ncbi:MAG: zinc-ribbon domain-containing protein, partial [Clostridia bacterium]|nr:zinc-ribbon domain-containing protein [Clostridia bacterium]
MSSCGCSSPKCRLCGDLRRGSQRVGVTQLPPQKKPAWARFWNARYRCFFLSSERASRHFLEAVSLARNNDKNVEGTMIGPGSHKKVIWHGKCGHEWEAPIRNRVNGAGCPYCSHNIVLPGFNDLQTLLPELAKEWSERNLPLLPSQVTAHVNRKVWWKCSKGHEWNTLISTRSYGSKCPYCSSIITLKGFNDFAT